MTGFSFFACRPPARNEGECIAFVLVGKPLVKVLIRRRNTPSCSRTVLENDGIGLALFPPPTQEAGKQPEYPQDSRGDCRPGRQNEMQSALSTRITESWWNCFL
jgi:hypothetical protein